MYERDYNKAAVRCWGIMNTDDLGNTVLLEMNIQGWQTTALELISVIDYIQTTY